MSTVKELNKVEWERLNTKIVAQNALIAKLSERVAELEDKQSKIIQLLQKIMIKT